MLQPTRLNALLEPEKRYSFSDFFDSRLSVRDIVRGFGWTLGLDMSPIQPESPDVSFLRHILEVNQRRVPLDNEMARRNALISPVLTQVCDLTDLTLNIEYGIEVSPHLNGVIDYQIEATSALLVVEAKQSDLIRGFKQLAVELIAACYWHQTLRSMAPITYGSITDGERWQFACADLEQQTIHQDREVYALSNLEGLTGTLVALLR